MIKPVKQRFMHDPENGVTGDCWIACISSITGIDIEEFPDPNDWDFETEWSKYWVAVHDCLAELGWDIYTESIPSFKGTGEDVIAVGKSPRSPEVDDPENIRYHAVVWNDGIVHDPHPKNSGIHSIVEFEILTKTQ